MKGQIIKEKRLKMPNRNSLNVKKEIAHVKATITIYH